MLLTIFAQVETAAWEPAVSDRQAIPVWTSACLHQRQLEDGNATVFERLLQLSILAGLACDHYLCVLTRLGVTASHRACSLAIVKVARNYPEAGW